MRNKRFKSIFVLLSVGLLILVGCSARDADVKLLIYAQENEDVAGAYELYINLKNGTMRCATEPLYQVQKDADIGNFDRDTIYPLSLCDDIMVLRAKPLQAFRTPCEILEQSKWKEFRKNSMVEGEFISFKQIWNEDEQLNYTADEKCETYEIEKKGEQIGKLQMEVEENERFEPLAFFLDQDGTLALMCNRTKGSLARESYPVSIVAEKRKNGNFTVIQRHSFQSMFDETLSQNTPPYSEWFGENIYGDTKTECFYWNESCNIVKMNPYDGSFHIIVRIADIEKDIPTLDTNRESYDFIWNYGRQNEINILIFPNYNDVQGMIAAFYNDEGSYLGRILIGEETVLLFNRENAETAKNEEHGLLSTFLYAPINSAVY